MRHAPCAKQVDSVIKRALNWTRPGAKTAIYPLLISTASCLPAVIVKDDNQLTPTPLVWCRFSLPNGPKTAPAYKSLWHQTPPHGYLACLQSLLELALEHREPHRGHAEDKTIRRFGGSGPAELHDPTCCCEPINDRVVDDVIDMLHAGTAMNGRVLAIEING